MRGSVQKARRDAGLCMDCGEKAPRNPTYLHDVARRIEREKGIPFERLVTDAICGKCMDKRRAKAAKKKERRYKRRLAYRDRVERGLCRRAGCPNEPVPGKTSCQSCLDKDNRSTHDRYKRRQDAGLCRCGKSPPTEGYKTCLLCRAAARRSRAALADRQGNTGRMR